MKRLQFLKLCIFFFVFVFNLYGQEKGNYFLKNFDPKLSKLSYVETLNNTIKNTDIKELFNLAIKKQIKLPEIQLIATNQNSKHEFTHCFTKTKIIKQQKKID